MKKINTVLGALSQDDCKRALVHEHLFLDMTHEAVEPKSEAERIRFYGDIRMDMLGLLRRNPYVVRTNLILDNVDDAVSEMRYPMERGCTLLVDQTSVGLGRDVQKLREVSARTGLSIACGCGLFVHDSLPSGMAGRTVEQLADWITDEIEHGIADTGIKPAIIGEIGTSEILYPIEERSLHAAALAHNRTGLPVSVHTYPWSRAGFEAIQLLMADGVPAGDICVCHLDVTFDEAYIRSVLACGVYVEFDNLGKEFYFEPQEGAFSGGPFETDVARAHMIRALCAQGFTGQLLLSNDLCLKASLRKYGGYGYDHLATNFAPMLRMEGVQSEAIEQMLEDNVKRFLFRD
ncbi:MAG: hypothetical protein RSD95_09205 [Clostridia bacterium]